MSAIPATVSDQQHDCTDSTLGSASTESQFALRELRVEWRKWRDCREASPVSLPGPDLPSGLPLHSATGSLSVSRCLSSSEGSQLRPRSSSRILNRDYHLALNNKCGRTVNKSHHKAAVLRLTTANLLRLLSAASRTSLEKSENEQQSIGVGSFS